MRSLIAASVVSAAFVAFAARASLLAVDDAPATAAPENQADNPPRQVRSSDKAVVKDVVYGLEVETNRLFLTSQPLSGDDRALKRVELKFSVPEGSQIAELALSKMDGKNLMAVVKIRRGEEYDFHCLTFIAPWGPWGSGHVREGFGFHKAKFFTTRDNLKILAVGGKHYAGSVFIVLGNIEPDEEQDAGTVTEGVFYFSGCPWPPSDGMLSPFRVKSVPPKDTAN